MNEHTRVSHRLLRRIVSLAMGMVATFTILIVVAEPSRAATLWHCQLPNGPAVCTRITGAPSSGVQVRERNTNTVVRLYNGDSVALGLYWNDRSGLCGINGDPYVWHIAWYAGTLNRNAYIGDYYLDTGAPTSWRDYLDPNGRTLGSRFAGYGGGTCNLFPNG